MPEDWQKLSTPDDIESDARGIDDGTREAPSGPSHEVLAAIGARPGDDSERSNVARAPIALAMIVVTSVWIALELWGLGNAAFHTKGEPREALVVWEMTHGSSWVLPLRNGTELPSKPPLFHWLAASASQIMGVLDEGVIRLPSALASLLVALMVTGIGGIVWSARTGLLAALVLLTNFEWARAAVNARVDMVLTLGLSMAMLSIMAFLRTRSSRWLYPLYGGIILAVLSKGPVGIVLPAIVMIAVCVSSRDVTPIQQMRLLRGGLAVLLLGGSWYALAYQEGGWDFIYKQVLDENVFRFFGSDELSGGHRHSALRLYALLLAGLLPWTIVLPAVLRGAWRERHDMRAQSGLGFLLLWSLVVIAFYSIPASKRPEYLLSMYPAIALMIGWWFDSRIRHAEPDLWLGRPLLLGAIFGLAIGIVPLALLLMHAVGLRIEGVLGGLSDATDAAILGAVQASLAATKSVSLGASIAILGGAVAIFVTATSKRFESVFLSLFAIAAAAIVLTQHSILPSVASVKTERDLMADVRERVEPGHTIFFHDTFDYGAVYYWGGHIPTFDGAWPAEAPRYVLTSRSKWQRNRAAAIHHFDIARHADGEPIRSDRLVLIERKSPLARPPLARPPLARPPLARRPLVPRP